MSVVHIGGPDDERVSAYRSVSDAALLREGGLFVAEGRLVVERLVTERRFAIQSLLLSETARRTLEPVLATLPAAVPVYVCEAEAFRGITGYDVHRGCLALAARPALLSVDAVLARARLIVGLEGVANADNVGGVFRNAAAFGAGAVLLDAASCDPLYRKAIRTSMAATLRVPFARLAAEPGEWPLALADLKRRGFMLVALTPDDSALDLDEFAASAGSARLAILIGSEGPGLTAVSRSAADCCVRIPISRDVDSLNLAVAAGIALHRLARGRAGTFADPCG
jgi:tRNA G18 (ribose-2'-O)-methylase SpoU